MTQRREFIKKSALGSGAIAIGAMGFSRKSYASIVGANERINLAIIGIRNQGMVHINRFCELKESHNVVIKTLCDADERLFASRLKAVSDKTGATPGTEWDMRKVFEDKDIHAVSIVTPNHWHALATVWACQAGKHVYVEKPVSHNIFEGRKMVEAGIKYKRHIQHGASPARGEALDFLLSGGIGKVYMVRGLVLHRRDSYGIASKETDTAPPEGFHYDMWLGPAPYKPYNEKRSHYCWHWYWDTGSGDTGNTGPHSINSALAGIQKSDEHPVSAFSNGGLYGFSPVDKKTPGKKVYGDVETYGDNMTTQETPNIQTCVFKYSDGTLFEFETRNRQGNTEGTNNIQNGLIFYGTEGYMEFSGGWKAFRNFEKQPFAGAGIGNNSAAERGPRLDLYGNFLDVLRSGKDEDLINPIITGHHGASLVHLANISYRLGGRSLNFDKDKEKFINDREANELLTRNYRKPFVVPDKV